jgi:hypothetical protein
LLSLPFFIGTFCFFIAICLRYLSLAAIRLSVSLSLAWGWPWGLISIVKRYSYEYTPNPFRIVRLRLMVWSINNPWIWLFYQYEFRKKDLFLIIPESNVPTLPLITNFSGYIHEQSPFSLGHWESLKITLICIEGACIQALQILY